MASDIGFHPVGTGPYQLSGNSNQTDFVKVKSCRLLAAGLTQAGFYYPRPVTDNNTRAAMLQTGEAQFAFPIPYEQAALLAKNKTSNWSPARPLCSVISV